MDSQQQYAEFQKMNDNIALMDKELTTRIVSLFARDQPKLVQAIARAVWAGETVQQIEVWAKELPYITPFTLNNILLIAEYFDTGEGAKLLPTGRKNQAA